MGNWKEDIVLLGELYDEDPQQDIEESFTEQELEDSALDRFCELAVA
jgi:hypothetical protein